MAKRIRVTDEKVASTLAEHPDWSEADAKRYLRGHGSPGQVTPEHGKILAERQLAGRRIIETHSSQALEREIHRAAVESREKMALGGNNTAVRISITVTDRSGRSYTLYDHPDAKHGMASRGMTAHYLEQLMEDSGMNAKEFLAEHVYTLGTEHIVESGGVEVSTQATIEPFQSWQDIDTVELTFYGQSGSGRTIQV